ncbi:hypothetical protein E2C01_079842 [Portunus trituberculatus]|uniref:Uncharacterized protein n=1 Tax=Portunus trituberculatus TaxID=210409 RepID=A0A5B7IRV7_PORTR|nr:hypothetical protein [Portunus trituberculatus]
MPTTTLDGRSAGVVVATASRPSPATGPPATETPT